MKIITNSIAALLLSIVFFACSESTSTTAADNVADSTRTIAKNMTGDVENYNIDIKGAHAFIMFKVKHLGYSWLHGRFNDFDGSFSYDTDNPNNSTISVSIDTNSVDSNHAERDKHLRSADFLDVEKYPSASFKSTSVDLNGGMGTVTGTLTLHGVTKEITMDVEEIGVGKDPWGGYRRGFRGTASFKMADFGITKNLGPASEIVYMELNIEGLRH